MWLDCGDDVRDMSERSQSFRQMISGSCCRQIAEMMNRHILTAGSLQFTLESFPHNQPSSPPKQTNLQSPTLSQSLKNPLNPILSFRNDFYFLISCPHSIIQSAKMQANPRLPPRKFQQDGEDGINSNDFQDISDDEPSAEEPSPSNINKNTEDYETLDELISKLNDDDHSEDQGIEDYIIQGYHPCHIGEVLLNRYVLIQKLGWGHFSTVWLAKDFKYSSYVAIKIMKSAKHYLEASYDEIEILQKVAKNALNPAWLASLKDYEKDKKKYDRDDCHVLNLLNAFIHKGPYGNHFCMVFEILGINLWEVLKKYDCKGLPINIVKEITRQVLMGLDFLNRICRVIHTDLKPENVLLCLTEEELRKIVEDEQLSNQSQFRDRLNYYCEKFQLGPVEKKEVKEESQASESLQSDNESNEEESEISTIDSKIKQLNEKLQGEISKNYQRTLRKKLKKLQEDRELELQKVKSAKKSKPKKQAVSNPSPVSNKSPKQLFQNFKHKISFDTTNESLALSKGFKVKIADLGNACWQHHHFATQIQTRQYRSPEVLLGSKYNLSADMWSLACMTFELLTGQLLFNPKKDPNENFGKNDDHLAQIMQLTGRFPKKMSKRGEKAKKYISKQGCLNRIPKLQNWSLKDVMIAKYRFKEQQAELFQSFMSPMLNCYPEKRLLARDILNHRWLHEPSPQQYKMDYESHQRLRLQRYDVNDVRDEIYQYESENQDGSNEDNDGVEEEQLYTTEKMGEIRLIDRSYTDLGYIGYGTGIYLEKLDFGPNWQFS